MASKSIRSSNKTEEASEYFVSKNCWCACTTGTRHLHGLSPPLLDYNFVHHLPSWGNKVGHLPHNHWKMHQIQGFLARRKEELHIQCMNWRMDHKKNYGYFLSSNSTNHLQQAESMEKKPINHFSGWAERQKKFISRWIFEIENRFDLRLFLK